MGIGLGPAQLKGRGPNGCKPIVGFYMTNLGPSAPPLTSYHSCSLIPTLLDAVLSLQSIINQVNLCLRAFALVVLSACILIPQI